jgi:hypothetical protein
MKRAVAAQNASCLVGISRHESFYRKSTEPRTRTITRQKGTYSCLRGTIGEVVYEAMIGILNVPKNDRFQVIAEHPAEGFIFDPTINIPGLRIQRMFSWALRGGEVGGLPGEFYQFANSIRSELSAVSVRPL